MKNKKLVLFNLINLIFFIYAICLSTGYALFSDTINLSGVARTVTYYSGTNLPVTGVIVDTGRNRYYTYSNITGQSFVSAAWTNSTIAVVHKKTSTSTTTRTVTYTASFRNDTVLTMTAGTATAAITRNDYTKITSVTASSSAATILPGGTTILTLVVKYRFNSLLGTQIVTGTFPYTFQNSTKYVYFTFTYQP